jgi:hypothetical protein
MYSVFFAIVVRCQFECLPLCVMNVLGQGVTPDAPRAAGIFTDLAMKGHPYAQVSNNEREP